MTTLNDIKNHMINYISQLDVPTIEYDLDGYCSRLLYFEIKDYWANRFITNEDFIYVVSCKWAYNNDQVEIDLDGGRSYILSHSNIKPLLFNYLYFTLGYSLSNYQDIIYNTTDLTDDIEDMYSDLSFIREHKINIINSDKLMSPSYHIILKYPKSMKNICDSDEKLKFVGLSLINSDPIYSSKIDIRLLQSGFEIIKSVDDYLN